MDSQEKNESRVRLQEEALARRMGEALDRISAAGAGECPDAELIAAYHERALQPDEIALWEGHFAGCSRCRKILAVLAASVDAPLAETEVARLGELIAAAERPASVATPRTAKVIRSNRFDWRARWLAPALGVAAVLAVWFAMRAPWRATGQRSGETLVAQAPNQEGPTGTEPAGRLSRAVPEQDKKAEAVASTNLPAANAPSLNSPAEVPAKGRMETGNRNGKISPSAGPAADSLQEKKESGGLTDQRENQASAGAAPPEPSPQAKAALGTSATPPLPQVRAQADSAVPPGPEVPQSAAQSMTVTESAPQVGTTNETLGGTIQRENSASLPLNGRNYQALATLRAARANTILLKAPSGSILWRVGKGGVIERSANAGNVWVSEKSPSQEDWLGGAAVSDAVGWVVGRNGAIARTADGERWERINSPAASAQSGKLPDWIGVVARDAQNATITAGDGRRYVTQAGGKTWQAQ